MSVGEELEDMVLDETRIIKVMRQVIKELSEEGIDDTIIKADLHLQSAVAFLAGRRYERELSKDKWTIN